MSRLIAVFNIIILSSAFFVMQRQLLVCSFLGAEQNVYVPLLQKVVLLSPNPCHLPNCSRFSYCSFLFRHLKDL